MTGHTPGRFRDNVRGIWTLVAQQIESRLPAAALPPAPHAGHHPLQVPHFQVPRRRNRYLKDKDIAEETEGDDSLMFEEDDDFRAFRGRRAERTPRGGITSTRKSLPSPPSLTRTRTPNHAAPLPPLEQKDTEEDPKMQLDALPDEEASVDMLIGLMGEGFDHVIVRRVLRKFDGNIEKAATALLEGDRGDDVSSSSVVATNSQTQTQTQIQSQSQTQSLSLNQSQAQSQVQSQSQTPSRMQVSQSQRPRGRPNTPVIDLTLDEDADFQRAMQESMELMQSQSQALYAPSQTQPQIQMQTQTQTQTPSEGPVFGPSARAPDPNWAMVPSDQADLERAIEASLEQNDSDALEPFPVEQQLRRDGCPVVLRPSMHTAIYATSILQGLFYVPQVRERVACWRPPVLTEDAEPLAPKDGPDYILWTLSEIFTHMDLARLCDLNVDKLLPAFNIDPWPPSGKPGEFSRKFFTKLAATLEKAFVEQFVCSGEIPPEPRLLHFQYGGSMSEPGEILQETPLVPIDVNGGQANDLIGCLSAQLSKPEPGKQSVIFEPSEVVAFELSRASPSNNTVDGGRVERKLFTYPKSIFLDQFLKENVELAHAKRKQRLEMYEEVQRLVLRKMTLTHFNGKDTLKDLRSTIFYYESVAEAKDDPERAASIKATAEKLKGILTAIEEDVKVTQEKIDRLRAEADTLLDCEELQQFRYDLRVVFVHDGQYGRKHLYSYVHDKSCWWKIADWVIEKVPEEVVLNDEMGLHLNAGPYLLFYSRARPEREGPPLDLPWPEDIKDDVRTANRVFLSQLPPELVGDIVIEEVIGSPPGADAGMPQTCSTSSESVAHVSGALEEGMDVS